MFLDQCSKVFLVGESQIIHIVVSFVKVLYPRNMPKVTSHSIYMEVLLSSSFSVVIEPLAASMSSSYACKMFLAAESQLLVFTVQVLRKAPILYNHSN